jgi:hypothetical protein
MKFNRDLAIKGALVVAILIVIGVSAHLYSKRKEEHFEGNIDIDALRGFSKGDPGSNWNDQDLWNKGTHQVPTISGGTPSQFKNNIVNMILAKAATEASSGRVSVKTGIDSKIATVQSDMNAISNQVGTNKSEQDVINADRQTDDDNEPTRISNQIAIDNKQDNKKIATAVANQASKQTAKDNTQDITITSMAAKNTKQDENITKLDLPVGTIMAYAPDTNLGSVETRDSLRGILKGKGWAVCDIVSNGNAAAYGGKYIPDLTDRFLKGDNFTPATVSAETAATKRIGQSAHQRSGGLGNIRLIENQMPPHSHSYQTEVHTTSKSVVSGGYYGWINTNKTTGVTGGDGVVGTYGHAIDIRPPFYKVVYIMKFKSVLG